MCVLCVLYERGKATSWMTLTARAFGGSAEETEEGEAEKK